jgi:threonine dehydratase
VAFAAPRRGLSATIVVPHANSAEKNHAMRAYFSDTHNVVEGAAGAGLAAVLRERNAVNGRRIGVVFTGGNVDSSKFARVLSEA